MVTKYPQSSIRAFKQPLRCILKPILKMHLPLVDFSACLPDTVHKWLHAAVRVFRLGKCVRMASYRAKESLRCHQSLHEALWVFGLEVGSEGAGLRS